MKMVALTRNQLEKLCKIEPLDELLTASSI